MHMAFSEAELVSIYERSKSAVKATEDRCQLVAFTDLADAAEYAAMLLYPSGEFARSAVDRICGAADSQRAAGYPPLELPQYEYALPPVSSPLPTFRVREGD